MWQVKELIARLGEDPNSLATWALLDADCEAHELISQEEFMVFLSIKRTEDEIVKPEALRRSRGRPTLQVVELSSLRVAWPLHH